MKFSPRLYQVSAGLMGPEALQFRIFVRALSERPDGPLSVSTLSSRQHHGFLME